MCKNNNILISKKLKIIEKLRRELILEVEKEGFNTNKVLSLSQKLDKKLNLIYEKKKF
ncbi:MAG: Spo0E family sporulation regulatory protein-aspartic acid phosphatase [Halanaerobiales bacterium]